jgi:hypothetical protein
MLGRPRGGWLAAFDYQTVTLTLSLMMTIGLCATFAAAGMVVVCAPSPDSVILLSLGGSRWCFGARCRYLDRRSLYHFDTYKMVHHLFDARNIVNRYP